VAVPLEYCTALSCFPAGSRESGPLWCLRYQPFNRLLFRSKKKADVLPPVKGHGLNEFMITTMRAAQNGKRRLRWDVVSEFKKVQRWSRGRLVANIDQGSMNPGFLCKPQKSRLRFLPVEQGCALVKLKAEEAPLLVNRY